MTSTYFEGQALANPLARRGYSRDQRRDCKQVCIALVVSREGVPVGYQLFAGNKADVTTVEEIVTTIEERYGQAQRIWVMDRGMVSQANIEFLKEGGRRYIVGTPQEPAQAYDQHFATARLDAGAAGLGSQALPRSRRGQRDLHPLPLDRPGGQGTGHAPEVREADRRGPHRAGDAGGQACVDGGGLWPSAWDDCWARTRGPPGYFKTEVNADPKAAPP